MAEGIVISTVIAFIKIMSPIAALLSIVLFLKPKAIVEMEKRLSIGTGAKQLKRKSIELLEKENLALQQLLIQYNRLAGIIIFVLSLLVVVRLHLHVNL